MSRLNAIRVVFTLAFFVAMVFAFIAWGIAVIGNDEHIPPLMAAAMTAGLAFVASVGLMLRDSRKHSTCQRTVQGLLEQRPEMSEKEFLVGFAEMHKPTAIHVRKALAAYFKISSDKIYPDDDMHRIYQIERLTPDLQFYVVSFVMAEYHLAPASYQFRSLPEANVSDLVHEVEHIISNCH